MHITIVIHLEGACHDNSQRTINSINAMIIEKNVKLINVVLTT